MPYVKDIEELEKEDICSSSEYEEDSVTIKFWATIVQDMWIEDVVQEERHKRKQKIGLVKSLDATLDEKPKLHGWN